MKYVPWKIVGVKLATGMLYEVLYIETDSRIQLDRDEVIELFRDSVEFY